jgi:UDP-glucose 4-epimerase
MAVWDPDRYQLIEARRRAEPRSEWELFWEYGAFVDVRDVASAAQLALTIPLAGHHRALLCAADISATAPSLDLVARLAPGVLVTDPVRYRADPWSALVDCEVAAATLGWRPRYRWSERGRSASDGLSPRPGTPPRPGLRLTFTSDKGE